MLREQQSVVGHDVIHKQMPRAASVQIHVVYFNILPSYRELSLLVVNRARLVPERVPIERTYLKLNSTLSCSNE